ncbi:phosphatase PAP2 family protein [Tenacibaculum amylolyticum]|uniref:phosphatase PAP2 family protein n=1 Tax=Tenacibaculum amylolyticum TaxID=104269 RepID=UPI0038936524
MSYNKVITSDGSFKKQQSIFSNVFLSIRKEVFIIYGLFFLGSLFMVSAFNKLTLHLEINKFHFSFLDSFFKYTTFLGDGVMFGVLTLIFLFVKRKMALVFAISGILTLLITYIFKKIIFSGMPRPAAALGEESLHLVEGVKMAFWNTFPSGHTITAFAIFTILCLYFKKCVSQYLWIGLALIAGISRVYLSQHFWGDIFVGSILGILIAFISVNLVFPKGKSFS